MLLMKIIENSGKFCESIMEMIIKIKDKRPNVHPNRVFPLGGLGGWGSPPVAENLLIPPPHQEKNPPPPTTKFLFPPPKVHYPH